VVKVLLAIFVTLFRARPPVEQQDAQPIAVKRGL
jgi:hypothetical protein